jgi:hypothetical protein
MVNAHDTVRHADQLRDQAAALIQTTPSTPDGPDHAGVGSLLLQASALETLAWQSVFDQHDAALALTEATAV